MIGAATVIGALTLSRLPRLRHALPYIHTCNSIAACPTICMCMYLRHARRAGADGLRARASPDEGGCARRGARARARGVREVCAHGADRGAPAGIVTVMVAVMVMVIVIVE